MNQRVLTVARREFLARVRSRWFLFSTLVVPVLFLGGIILPAVLVDRSIEDPKPIVIIDYAGNGIADRLIDSLRASEIPAERLADRARSTAADPFDLDSLRSRIAAKAGSAEADAATAWLYLPGSLIDEGAAVLVENRDTGPVLRRRIASILQRVITAARLERARVGTETIETALRPTSVSVEPLIAKDGPAGLRQALGFVFAMALYVMFIVYGQMIARGVLEEKTSDIVEILISSLRPWEMMLGKIVGIGAVGLTQVAIWVLVVTSAALFGLAGAAAGLAQLGLDISGLATPWDLILWSILYFITGYLLYSGVFASAGALVTSEQDVQQVLIPALLPIVLPILVLPAAMQTPDATWVVAMSLFPFFSPILMPMRIAASHVPLWQSALAVVLLLGTTLALAWTAGRIYRVGILMKGKRPNLPELVRWLRHG
jgi:ABC-2 type transport system permease protein